MTKAEVDRLRAELLGTMVPGTEMDRFAKAFVAYTQAVVEYIEERTDAHGQVD